MTKVIRCLPQEPYYDIEHTYTYNIAPNVVLTRIYGEKTNCIFYYLVVNHEKVLLTNFKYHAIINTLENNVPHYKKVYKYVSNHYHDVDIIETSQGLFHMEEKYYNEFTWE